MTIRQGRSARVESRRRERPDRPRRRPGIAGMCSRTRSTTKSTERGSREEFDGGGVWFLPGMVSPVTIVFDTVAHPVAGRDRPFGTANYSIRTQSPRRTGSYLVDVSSNSPFTRVAKISMPVSILSSLANEYERRI